MTERTSDQHPTLTNYRSSIPQTTLKIPMPPGVKPPRPAPEPESSEKKSTKT
jgi:hypothetical protein